MQGFIVASNCQVLSVRLCDFVLGPIAGHFKYFKSHDPRKVKRKAETQNAVSIFLGVFGDFANKTTTSDHNR